MPTPPEPPSRQTLERTVTRVMVFTMGVVRYPAIAAILATKGYGPKAHEHVWTRLKKLGELPAAPAAAGLSDKAVRAAIIELDAWDEPNYDILRAVLESRFPAFRDSLFQDLEPKQGSEAVYGISTLLDRLDALETGANPDAPAILELLSERSYTPAERARLRGLVQTATTFAASQPVSDTERTTILTELYAWYKEWSTIAKRIITRRQHLIALGLATPRKSTGGAPGGEGPGGPSGPTG